MISNEKFKEYKELFLADMKEGIDKVFSGELQDYNNNFVSAHDMRDYLRTLGYKDGDLDTNGWDYDFWWTYKINSKKYTIGGCGYSAKCYFTRDEIEEGEED